MEQSKPSNKSFKDYIYHTEHGIPAESVAETIELLEAEGFELVSFTKSTEAFNCFDITARTSK